MLKTSVGIIDYGVGNLFSVQKSLTSIGFRAFVSRDIDYLSSSDLLLLPGVGAFPTAMNALKHYHLDQFILNSAQMSKPIVGICLGMQLLTTSSDEVQFSLGLDLIPGNVVALDSNSCHIGWNQSHLVANDSICSLLIMIAFTSIIHSD